MTRLLTWHPEWALGIDALDRDHRALVGSLNNLCLRFCPQAAVSVSLPGYVGAVATRTSVFGGADLRTLIEAMVAFGAEVHDHCRREDAFMRAIHYPHVEEHAHRHLRLMEEFNALLVDWRVRGLTVLDERCQEQVRHWLVGHILGPDDREIASYYFELCGLANPLAGYCR